MNGYEALAQLPEDIQKLALIETRIQQDNIKEFMENEFKGSSDFLMNAFYWEESTQGHNFWSKQADIQPTV